MEVIESGWDNILSDIKNMDHGHGECIADEITTLLNTRSKCKNCQIKKDRNEAKKVLEDVLVNYFDDLVV